MGNCHREPRQKSQHRTGVWRWASYPEQCLRLWMCSCPQSGQVLDFVFTYPSLEADLWLFWALWPAPEARRSVGTLVGCCECAYPGLYSVSCLSSCDAWFTSLGKWFNSDCFPICKIPIVSSFTHCRVLIFCDGYHVGDHRRVMSCCLNEAQCHAL